MGKGEGIRRLRSALGFRRLGLFADLWIPCVTAAFYPVIPAKAGIRMGADGARASRPQ